jgi:hypothetical protein
MGGRAIQKEVRLLYILAVIAFGPRQTKQALFEDRVRGVPEGEREAQPHLVIAEPE